MKGKIHATEKTHNLYPNDSPNSSTYLSFHDVEGGLAKSFCKKISIILACEIIRSRVEDAKTRSGEGLVERAYKDIALLNHIHKDFAKWTEQLKLSDKDLIGLCEIISKEIKSLIEEIEIFKDITTLLQNRKQGKIDTKHHHIELNHLENKICLSYATEQKSKSRELDQFIKFLKVKGKQGRKYAELLKKNRPKNTDFWSSDFYIEILIKTIINDVFLVCIQKTQRHPAITRESMDKGFKRAIQETNPIICVNDRGIEYFSEGDKRSLGCIPITSKDLPNVHPDIVPIIKAGGQMIGSFMSHRLLHYENKLFYDRWNNNEKDFRKFSIEGGYAELARKLGYSKGGKNVEKLKKILYFQAGFWFTLPSLGGGSKTGNLITLTEHKNKFGEIGQLDIIAGSMLTPEAVYTASKEDGGNLLIPFVDLPEKMLGNPATWGAQAFLQMLIIEYMTMNSREFAGKESVRITQEQWGVFVQESNLPPTFLKRIKELQQFFCCPNQGFLDIQGEECTFNKRNEKATKHLIVQGQRRENRSKQATLKHTNKNPQSAKNKKSKTNH